MMSKSISASKNAEEGATPLFVNPLRVSKSTDIKIVIVGDIHLQLRGNYKAWEEGRFLQLFRTIALESKPDVVILNGDIFDRAKITYDELALFYKAIAILTTEFDTEVYVVDGNHEEFSATTTIFDKIPECGFTRVKYGILEINSNYSLCLVGHPFLSEVFNLAKMVETKHKFLISHYRSKIKFADEEVDNERVSQTYDHTFLSDIHYPFFPKPNICYTSSPYSIHFTTNQTERGYIELIIGEDDYSFSFKKLDLPSKVKLQLSVTMPEEEIREVIKSLNPKNLYVVEFVGVYNKVLHRKFSSIKNVISVDFKDTFEEDYGNLSDEVIKELTEHDSSIDLVDTIEEFMNKNTITKKHREYGRPELRDCVT